MLSTVALLLSALSLGLMSGSLLAALSMQTGWFRLARLFAWLSRDSVHGRWQLFHLALLQGRSEEAYARISQLAPLITQLPGPFVLMLANSFLNVAVNSGRYREALAWRRVVRKVMRAYPAEQSTALIIVNSVEALYNLGRWRSAERICRNALAQNVSSDAMAIEGLQLQLAWISCRNGKVLEAEALLARVSADAFPAVYRAEVFFTQSACALAKGELSHAHALLGLGEAVARRASSVRNAHFLRAEILLAEGRVDRAERAFRVGAAHAYRGQGGHSLAAWSAVLEGQGRTDDAARARALVFERDPQSESARRLGAPPARLPAPGPVLEVRTLAVASPPPAWVKSIGLASASVLLATAAGLFAYALMFLSRWPPIWVAAMVGSVLIGGAGLRVARLGLGAKLLERYGPRWEVPAVLLGLLVPLTLVGLSEGDSVATFIALGGLCIIGLGWSHSLGQADTSLL